MRTALFIPASACHRHRKHAMKAAQRQWRRRKRRPVLGCSCAVTAKCECFQAKSAKQASVQALLEAEAGLLLRKLDGLSFKAT